MNSAVLGNALLEQLSTAVLLLDEHLSVRYANPAAEQLFATSRTHLLGRSIALFFWEDDECLDALNNALLDQQPYTRREARLHFPSNGQVITIDYTATPFNGAGQAGKQLLVELFPQDRVLRLSREDNLFTAHQVTRALVRGVAHEVKNPLGGIRGATQLLARSLDNPEYKEFTDIIISEVDRLRTLADSMLGSRQLPSYELVNIHEPLERVRSLIANQTKKKIKITRDYDLSLPEILADRDQLIQVMLNICANAVQAMTENKEFFVYHQPELILRTRIQRLFTINGVIHRSVIRIDIEDNGPGVPEDILESVFYPLVTSRAKGTGLGLSIAQNIIHQHNGMIACQSVPEKTVFSLYLPWESNHVAK